MSNVDYEKMIDELFMDVHQTIEKSDKLPIVKQHEFLCDVSRYIEQKFDVIKGAPNM